MRTLLCAFIVLVLACPSLAHAFRLSYGNTGAASGDHEQYVRELVRRFNLRHPNSKIEVRGTESYLRPVVETLMYEGSAEVPDVAIVSLSEWPTLLSKKLLHPLSDFLSDAELASIRSRLRADRDVMYYGPPNEELALYHLPLHRSQPVLFINPTLFKLKGDAVTWTELEKALLAKRRSAKRSDALSLVIPTEDWTFEQLLLDARGAPTLDHRTARFNDPATQALFKQLQRLRDLGLLHLARSHAEAYSDFIEGRTVAVLLSFSSYNSVVHHSPFPVRALMPPTMGRRWLVSGGGDLILPRHPSASPGAREDIRAFLNWFYLEGGDGEWSEIVGYPPITTTGLKSPAFERQLASRAVDQGLYSNRARFKYQSFYRLDERCQIGKLHTAVVGAFTEALGARELPASLAKSESALNALLNARCP